MDLSMRHQSSEAFEYRHKKFDHIRNSPVTVQPIPNEETRSMAGTPQSFISNSTCRNSVKRRLEEDDTTWEPSAEDIEPPRTPTKRPRMQSRASRNKRTASYELCNAPKKLKSTQYDARAATPVKHADDMHTTASLMPKITKETLARICQYNKNMVRKFPKKERTVKDQERRDKNTIACRMSRRLKKLENLAVEEQYKIFIQEYLDQSRLTMHAAVYLNELLKFDVTVPPHEHNETIVNLIARKMRLRDLEKISTSKADGTEFAAIKRNIFQAEKSNVEKQEEEIQLIAQQKKSFSIASLLGAE